MPRGAVSVVIAGQAAEEAGGPVADTAGVLMARQLTLARVHAWVAEVPDDCAVDCAIGRMAVDHRIRDGGFGRLAARRDQEHPGRRDPRPARLRSGGYLHHVRRDLRPQNACGG